jgi:hypothetical protein
MFVVHNNERNPDAYIDSFGDHTRNTRYNILKVIKRVLLT